MKWHRVDTSTEHASRAGVSSDAQCFHLMLQQCADDTAFHSAPLAETMRRYDCDRAEAFARVLIRSGAITNITKRFRRGMAGWVRELCRLGYLVAEEGAREGMRLHSLADGQPIDWSASTERAVSGTSRGRHASASTRNHSTHVGNDGASDVPRSDHEARLVQRPSGRRQRAVVQTSRGRHATATARNDSAAEEQIRREVDQKRGGLTPPTRETPPQPLEPEHDPRQPLVRALADGAGELWSNDGEPWRRSALEEALAKHDFDEDEARSFGRFLKRTGVAESLKTKRVSPYWLVFGGSPGSAEFRHLDAAVKAFDCWCDAEEARLKSAAEQRQKQHARNEKSASPPVRSAEAVSAAARKALEEFKRLPKPITARSIDDEQPGEIEDEPNTTGAEQRGAEPLGAVLEGILGARTNAKASLPIEALGSGESGAPDRPPVRPGARPAPDGDPGRPLARSPASSGNHGAPGASAGHQPSPALTADEDEQPPDLRRRQGGRAPAEGTEPNATGGEQLHTEETHP